MNDDKLFINNFYTIENEIQNNLNILVHKNIISRYIADNTFNDILFCDLNLFYKQIPFSEIQQQIIRNVVMCLSHALHCEDINITYKVFICKSLDIKNDDIIQLINISDCEICYITDFLNNYSLLK